MDYFFMIFVIAAIIVIVVAAIVIINYYFFMPKEQRCEKRSTILGNEIVTYNGGCAEYYVTEKGYELKELKPQWGDDAYILQKGVTTEK